MAELSKREEAFAKSYAAHENGTKAATEAGYSKRSAHSQSTVLLKRPEVQERIFALRMAASLRTNVTVDRVLLEMARVAFADVRNIFDDDGNLLPPKEWDDETAASIVGLDTTQSVLQIDDRTQVTNHLSKVRRADKMAALDKLARHLQIYNDKITFEGLDQLAERLARARLRLDDDKSA